MKTLTNNKKTYWIEYICGVSCLKICIFLYPKEVSLPSAALSDHGKRRDVSGAAQSTFPTPQEEAEKLSWAGALRVRWIRWFRWTKARSHVRIQRRHCRWWDWDELCCTEHPAGTCAHFPQKILLCCYNNVSNFFPPEHHDKWIKAGGLIKKENKDWSFSPWRALKSPTAAGSTLPMKGRINLDLHSFCWLFNMKSSFNNSGICLKMWQLSNKVFFLNGL